eukprot:4130123-Pleurochrysis_carterae.AAC.2
MATLSDSSPNDEVVKFRLRPLQEAQAYTKRLVWFSENAPMALGVAGGGLCERQLKTATVAATHVG